jgi:hypothetical protein
MLIIFILLFLCLAFSLWLNFRLSFLVIFYANVPTRPVPGVLAHRGLEYQNIPIVPLVLKWMVHHYRVELSTAKLALVGENIKRAQTEI